MSRTVWVDCDPGHDDAFALILAAYHPKLVLGLVTTVWGNQTLTATTENALRVLQIAGISTSIPVIAGSESAVLQQYLDPSKGRALGEEWGFGGTKFPPLHRSANVNAGEVGTGKWISAVQAWLEAQPDKSVHCVPTGSLTNIAILFTVIPKLMHAKLNSISLMGGAIGLGNMSPAAEFNILADPEAARIVFGNSRQDLPVTVVPLEVTHTAIVSSDILSQIQALNSDFANISVSLLTCFAETYRDLFNFKDGPPLHDPVAVAYVADPNIFEVRRLYTEVVVGNGIDAGRTVVDMFGMLAAGNRKLEAEAQHVYVATDMKADQFWSIMMNAIVEANKNSVIEW